MGATTFTTYAWGRTAGEAFNQAVQDAQWEYGHGGYTGTIAEKPGFVKFDVPARVKTAKLIEILTDADMLEDTDWLKQNLAYAERNYAAAKTNRRALRAHVTAAKKELAQAERDRAKFRKGAGAMLPLVQEMLPTFRSKWDDAVCIEITSPAEVKNISGRYGMQKPKRGYKLFLFTGWASC